ncbi:hypothetical protein FGO68_gene12152 [Halteria grandinella]|uniref:TRP C-terminal domain-containing protein n=1 Tax=Halteria grandinella TaxID=5974 RepID=A0A8J8P5A8_HALGN|nr:hypothetical protein FGO68_gene12152 [Halteria grandinella]
MNMIYMDLLQTDKWMNKLVDLDDDNDHALCPSFERVGYTSMNTVSNLGSTFVFLIIMVHAYLLTILLYFFKETALKKAYEFMNKRLIWNGILRFMIQQYQSILLACFINTSLALQNFNIDSETMKYQTSTVGNQMSVFSNFILFASVTLLPLIIAFIIKKHRDLILTEKFISKFGTVLDGLNCVRSVYWHVFVLIRWGLSIGIFVYLKDFASLQIIILLFVSLGFTIAIAYKQPYSSKMENNFKIMIEVFVTWYLYLLLMLADITSDAQLREIFGFCVLGVIGLCVAANLLKALHAATKKILTKIKAKRRQKLYTRNETKLRQEFPLNYQSNNTTVGLSVGDVSQIQEDITSQPQNEESKIRKKGQKSFKKINLKSKNSLWADIKSQQSKIQALPQYFRQQTPLPTTNRRPSLLRIDVPNDLPISHSYKPQQQPTLINQMYLKVQQDQLMRQGSLEQMRHFIIGVADDNSMPAYIQRTMTKKPFSEQSLI